MSDVPVERFLAALPAGVDPAAAGRLGQELLDRWSEPQRRYHTLHHLGAVLSIVDANARFARNLAAVRLAAWFHDAVYDPTAGGGANEEASAELAIGTLGRLGLAPALVDAVAGLIRMTAGHDA